MTRPTGLRTGLFFGSAALMTIGAVGYAVVLMPDLHGDLVEIGVRPTVLGPTVLYLYFSAIAMFGFATLVSAAAVHISRGIEPQRIPLAIVAAVYTAFGVMAFSQSLSPHHLGPLAAGVMLGAAVAWPGSTAPPARPAEGDGSVRA